MPLLHLRRIARDNLSRLGVFKNDLKAAISTLNTRRENRGGISSADVAPISAAIAMAQANGLPATDPVFVEANTLNNTAKEQLAVQEKLSNAPRPRSTRTCKPPWMLRKSCCSAWMTSTRYAR